jgi:uncharacterized protein (DUF2141 family)
VAALLFLGPARVHSENKSAASATLTVKVVDLRNHSGKLIFGVFKTDKGFPSKEKNALNWQVRAIDKSEMVFTCQLPPGEYAASVLHDENDNGDMDTNLIGMPTEGYGVTNNPKPRFRAAKFKEALFTHSEDGSQMTISLQYF